MLTLWDYVKWILYALLLSVQLGFLFTLANTLGKPRVDEASIRVTSLAFSVLETLPPTLREEGLERLGLTKEGGVCMLTPMERAVHSAYNLTIHTTRGEYSCVWPSKDVYTAFRVTSQVMPGYARVHARFPLAFEDTLAWVELISLSKEGQPITPRLEE